MSHSRYDPFRESLSLRNAMDQLFAQSFVSPRLFGQGESNAAPIDVHEHEHGYEVHVALPGVKPEDIELTVHQNALTIKGEYHSSSRRGNEAAESEPQTQAQQPVQTQGQTNAEQKARGNWLVREMRSGSFQRTIGFDRPINADGIETSYEHGILTISIPVSEASKPRRIQIKHNQNQPQQVDVDTGSNT